VAPEIPDVSEMDRDHDRIDDDIDVAGPAADPNADVTVEAIFSRPIAQADIDAFLANGGTIKHVFRWLSYGWVGTLKRGALPSMVSALGSDLLVLAGDRPIGLHLDKATRTGRVRPVWVNGFAQGAGFSGAGTTTIAIVDTGVDGSHTDLTGRMVFWADATGESGTAIDPRGHGTHVAGIATGTGDALGLGTTLKYTDGGNLTGISSGSGFVHAIDLFGSPLSLTSVAHWSTGGTTLLALMTGDNGAANYTQVNNVVGASALTDTTSFTPVATKHYSPLLAQRPTAPLLTSYAIANTVTGYPAATDSFNTLRGVAPGCAWGAVKVFHSDGTGSSSELGVGLDDVVGNNVKVVNMSLGLTPANTTSTALRAKINSMVANGLVVVASAGNDGPTGIMSDPARAALALTVGAANDVNQLTDYTSTGFDPIADSTVPVDTREDEKPDVLAPGGSARYSDILSADSNTAEGDGPATTFPDLVPNDYAGLHGTSMAAPFTSGAAALVIQALESTGLVWSYASSAHPLLVKMLLSASATETNQLREGDTTPGATDPVLGRWPATKDRQEGYGIINPDAAIEAARVDFEGTFTGTTTGGPTDRRAWGRRIALKAGNAVSISLTSTSGDFDLYLYSATPNPKGNPVVLAHSTNAGSGVAEQISYTAGADATAYFFVKRVSGSGTFTCTGGVCGNGKLEGGEQCDDGNQSGADCCTPSCTIANNGASCDDGSKCTSGDSCQSGVCTGTQVTCTALDACHDIGVCNPATGACSTPAKADGASCTDGNQCTQGDACHAGLCVPGAAVTCAASDQCHDAGVCNPASGACSNPTKANGAVCNDGNACTRSDTCQAGVCTGANPVTCTASDQCHDVGTCDPASGACSNPSKANGTTCSDGSACTQTDTCQNGTCTGTNPVVCTALDQCHSAGTCDPANGSCSNPLKPNGSVCNDGNACTLVDTCQAGTCAGASPVVCAALDQCHDAGICDPASGACSNPAKANDTLCDDSNACTRSDSCQAGVCAGTNPVTCVAKDQCHDVGTCDTSTGVCSDPAKADGSTCNDGDACTQTDTCKAGACTGGNPVVCAPLDQCHESGTCDHATGICSNPIKSDGTACDDANACTRTDTCQNGSCQGTDPVACAALDDCHDVGSCDPKSGACNNPKKRDGSPCASGNCSTGVCQAPPDGGSDAASTDTTFADSAVGGEASVPATDGGASGVSPVAAKDAASIDAAGLEGIGIDAAAIGSAIDLQPQSSAGCGCRVASHRTPAGAWAAFALAAIAGARRKRSSPRRRAGI
jgi:MYXO-CTERM domain-containing protein